MRTVNEVSKLSGVSVRTLQYYDKIGLLKPTGYTESGYRLYDDTALEMLQQILLFRELQFPLKDIRRIISAPDFDRSKALEQQIAMLTMRKEHLENLIAFARGIQWIGVKTMDFSVFDTRKLDEYANQAKMQWGESEAYQEFEQKYQNKSEEEQLEVIENFVQIFKNFGTLADNNPEDETVQKQVRELQDFITQHFYHCTNDMFYQLGQMYAGGGEFTANIDQNCGKGTAAFTAEAIRIYCGK